MTLELNELPVEFKRVTRVSPKARQILTGVANGYSSKEIAGMLGTTEQTVKNKLQEIYNKLGITAFVGNPRVLVARWWVSAGHELPEKEARR